MKRIKISDKLMTNLRVRGDALNCAWASVVTYAGSEGDPIGIVYRTRAEARADVAKCKGWAIGWKVVRL